MQMFCAKACGTLGINHSDCPAFNFKAWSLSYLEGSINMWFKAEEMAHLYTTKDTIICPTI